MNTRSAERWQVCFLRLKLPPSTLHPLKSLPPSPHYESSISLPITAQQSSWLKSPLSWKKVREFDQKTKSVMHFWMSYTQATGALQSVPKTCNVEAISLKLLKKNAKEMQKRTCACTWGWFLHLSEARTRKRVYVQHSSLLSLTIDG